MIHQILNIQVRKIVQVLLVEMERTAEAVLPTDVAVGWVELQEGMVKL